MSHNHKMEINTTNVKHYFQGGYDCQFVEPFDGKFECPICLLCQRDPYQTVCGHRWHHLHISDNLYLFFHFKILSFLHRYMAF